MTSRESLIHTSICRGISELENRLMKPRYIVMNNDTLAYLESLTQRIMCHMATPHIRTIYGLKILTDNDLPDDFVRVVGDHI